MARAASTITIRPNPNSPMKKSPRIQMIPLVAKTCAP
jgi:hypothetical protein